MTAQQAQLALTLIAFAAVVLGVLLIFPPAALIVGGVGLFGVAQLITD